LSESEAEQLRIYWTSVVSGLMLENLRQLVRTLYVAIGTVSNYRPLFIFVLCPSWHEY